jgi:hypothetical protein
MLMLLQHPVYAQFMHKLDFRGNIQAHAFLNDSSRNWYRGGFAKLRYDEDAFPVQLGSAALHTDIHITDTFWVRSLVTANTYPEFDPNVIEAYFQFRPLPQRKFRVRTRTGAFHLPISLENRGLGWNSLYSVSPSVINAWVGEELRVIGGEIDDRPGYYASGEWSYLDVVELKLMHYDNRGNPTAFSNGQVAWHTVFEHASLQINLPNQIRLLTQYMSGDTQINNLNTGFRGDVDFEAWYVLVTRVINKHRISARYEVFSTDDNDVFVTSVHNSNESGWSWMLAYQYQVRANLKLGIEWLQIKSERQTREIIENIPSETENQLLFNINYTF